MSKFRITITGRWPRGSCTLETLAQAGVEIEALQRTVVKPEILHERYTRKLSWRERFKIFFSGEVQDIKPYYPRGVNCHHNIVPIFPISEDGAI